MDKDLKKAFRVTPLKVYFMSLIVLSIFIPFVVNAAYVPSFVDTFCRIDSVHGNIGTLDEQIADEKEPEKIVDLLKTRDALEWQIQQKYAGYGLGRYKQILLSNLYVSVVSVVGLPTSYASCEVLHAFGYDDRVVCKQYTKEPICLQSGSNVKRASFLLFLLRLVFWPLLIYTMISIITFANKLHSKNKAIRVAFRFAIVIIPHLFLIPASLMKEFGILPFFSSFLVAFCTLFLAFLIVMSIVMAFKKQKIISGITAFLILGAIIMITVVAGQAPEAESIDFEYEIKECLGTCDCQEECSDDNIVGMHKVSTENPTCICKYQT